MEMEVKRLIKNSTEDLVIQLSEFRGHILVNLRCWVAKGSAADKRDIPTRKGITFSLELLPDVIKGLQDALSFFHSNNASC